MRRQSIGAEGEAPALAPSQPLRRPGRIYRSASRSSTYAGRPPRSRAPKRWSQVADTRCNPLPQASWGNFSLRFRRPQRFDLPTWSEVHRFLLGLEGVILLPSKAGQNPVYEYYQSSTRALARFVGYQPTDSDDLGLLFELPLPCPHYFALETITMPVALARELGLKVEFYPLQFKETEESALQVEYAQSPLFSSEDIILDSLLEYWREANSQARALWEREHGPSPQYRRSWLEVVWEYRLLSQMLSQRYLRNARRYQYPDIHFYQDLQSAKVYTLCEWPNLQPMAFPVVDLIKLSDLPSPFPKEGKIVEARALFRLGKAWLKKEQIPIKHYLTRDNLHSPEFLEFIESLPSQLTGPYRQVEYAEIEDI